MRVEVWSPDGLESAYQGTLGKVERDPHGNVWSITTADGYGIVLLHAGELARLVAEVELVAK